MKLAPAFLPIVLSACIATNVEPRLSPLDLTLTRQCDAPSAIPPRDLSERDVAKLWGSDRLALKDCARRHAATVSIIEHRDASLSGN